MPETSPSGAATPGENPAHDSHPPTPAPGTHSDAPSPDTRTRDTHAPDTQSPDASGAEAHDAVGEHVERAVAALDMPDVLRAEVKLLGALLGTVLRESGGDDLLDDVETLRALTIGAFTHPESTEAIERAEAFVDSLDATRAEELARAFTSYFHLVNLAEENHRVRVLRARAAAADPEHPSTETLPGALAALAAEVGDEEAARRLAALEFRPVFTAHPTEARRRAVANAIRRIGALLAERDDPHTRGAVLAENERALLAEVDILWRTAPLRSEKPSPLDEVRTAMAVFDETLFGAVPDVYRSLDDAIAGEDAGVARPVAPAFVRLGSWIGADRDGNPNVTARITRTAAEIASEHVLLGLERATTRIARTLTLDASTTPPSPALSALREQQRQLAQDLAADIAERSPNEPHRQVMLFAAERIVATRRRDADLAYASAEELRSDLLVVQESLVAAGDRRSAYGELQRLLWQVETFGFHLAELEVRQHSKVHRTALAELRARDADPSAPIDDMTNEVLDVFRTIQHIQRRFGVIAARRYIVSFTQSSEDLANVYRLAQYAAGPGGEVPTLDVIPLFETFDDLQASTRILDEMLELPEVQARLAATGRRVEVMLGYSDSSKDVGPVAATLALYDAQARIAAWAERNDIVLTLFHGRGGALGRGGGPANQAVLAQPPGSVDGRFKLTEQGEVIFARYGNPVIAQRHIDQVASATLLASSPSNVARTSSAAEEFAPMAATMDEASRARFFELVKADGFAAWFAQVTPMEEIGWLALGSRPARRGLSVSSLEDLRAIPWVFAWTQARINLTGWFGLGTALAAVGDEALVRSAYERWPLFRAMIDNVEMSLAKTDDRIARRYLALGDRDDLAGLVLDEMALTRHWVLTATGSSSVLESRPVLRTAVQLRSPYVDALSLLQLRALRSLRAPEDAAAQAATQSPAAPAAPAAPDVRRLLLLSVSGVAAGLQNTG